MKWVKFEEGQRLPIKSWCEDVEDGAMEQVLNCSIHPVLFHHVALMPDAHKGFGLPIGGVIACDGAVIPYAIGSDISCGMLARKTDLKIEDLKIADVELILNETKKVVPVGFNHHSEKQNWNEFDNAPDIKIVQQELQSASHQLGTLGSNNHFIEIQYGDDGFVWLMIHSGSRNFGFKIAKEYHEKAVNLCERWHSDLPDKDLAFLPIETHEAKEYLEAMEFAMKFAHENRARMMLHFGNITAKITGCSDSAETDIDINHNYAAWENHFGKNVLVHRKGATLARKGTIGIIPGSMGTSSYIVRGLGNKDSFDSCSHGAGRVMGRADASRSLSKEDCDKAMDGIVFDGWGVDRKGHVDLGEAPQAYKDIDEVIEAELDLIEPLVKLRPLGVIKG